MRWTLPPLVLAVLVIGVFAMSGRPVDQSVIIDVPAGATEGPGWRRELQMDGTPQRNDPRFHALLRRVVKGYLKYTRIANKPELSPTDCDLPHEESFGQSEGLSDAPFEGPANCGTIGIGGGAGGSFKSRSAQRDAAETKKRGASRPPEPSLSGPLLSASDDSTTHGTKLYWLYVRDSADYLEEGSDLAVPVGQVLVKQAWATERVATDPHEGRTLSIDGALHHATHVKTLFVMTRVDAKTPGTDEGWVYGTLTPDGRTVTGAGRIQACMDCHAAAQRERLFGLKR